MELHRRADVADIFPNSAAFLRLATAAVIEALDEWQVACSFICDELGVVMARKERAAT